MEEKYKNITGNYISEQQAYQLQDYSIEYWIDGELNRIERIYGNELTISDYYLADGETHESILASEYGLNRYIVIFEKETHGIYKLEKGYTYDNSGVLQAISNTLYDGNYELVGKEWSDDLMGGVPDYSATIKYYYDRPINPDRELFEVKFNDDGSLSEIYYNNFHVHSDGQESIVFSDTPGDISELRNLTGISENLASWYVSNRVTPLTDLP